MAKLYFKYGAMGSSKTAQALITKYNYEENDLNVWLIKPGTDTRDGAKILRSRIGLEAPADVIAPGDRILSLDGHPWDGDVCRFLLDPDPLDGTVCGIGTASGQHVVLTIETMK